MDISELRTVDVRGLRSLYLSAKLPVPQHLLMPTRLEREAMERIIKLGRGPGMMIDTEPVPQQQQARGGYQEVYEEEENGFVWR